MIRDLNGVPNFGIELLTALYLDPFDFVGELGDCERSDDVLRLCIPSNSTHIDISVANASSRTAMRPSPNLSRSWGNMKWSSDFEACMLASRVTRSIRGCTHESAAWHAMTCDDPRMGAIAVMIPSSAFDY
ncbi:hypothetical protein GGI05_007798 [Coemansia sp. RSA 2603]|nr:hypothetical protein GGI05_007798 [Coemansia sp. RSA 2603]